MSGLELLDADLSDADLKSGQAGAGGIMADANQLPGLMPVSDTVTKLRERIGIKEQRKTLTAAQRKLLDDSAMIFAEPATKQDAAYLPRELVQVTLPHKNPGNVPV